MNSCKRIGIFMDHSKAHLIEYTSESIHQHHISSGFSYYDMQEAMQHGEHSAHNKEQQKQSSFYNEIAEVIEKYNHVLLFGPTNAKTELLHSLKLNQKFDDIHIDVQTTDKMTMQQMNAYVLNYFKTI